MLETFKDSNAFILMESLLALSIVSFAVVIILPYSVSMMESREDRRLEIEGYRLLYDYSSEWNQSESLVINRSNHYYSINQSDQKITVNMPNDSTVQLKVESH